MCVLKDVEFYACEYLNVEIARVNNVSRVLGKYCISQILGNLESGTAAKAAIYCLGALGVSFAARNVISDQDQLF